MKKLVLILALCLAFGSAVLSAPNIVIYRYRGIDIKMLPANLITDSNTATDPWVRDDAKWSAGKKTALLIHGFSIFSQEKCRNGMIGLAAHLSVSRRVGETTIPGYDAVYAVEYPAKYSVLDTAAVISDIVNSKCSSWPKEAKIDVFAHSMGGLVARTAIEYPEVLLGTKAITARVNHLVTMGTPHGGISSPVVDIFKEAFGQLPIEVGDMDTKGLFMNMLNFTSSKKPQVSCDYYSIVGAKSDCPKKFISDKHSVYAIIIKKIQDISYPVHDGLIEAASAGYDLSEVCHAFKKTPLDLNHDYIKSHLEVFSTIDRWMIDDKWFGAAEAEKQTETSLGNLSGLAPQILLGKTRAEIEKMFGTTYLMLNTFDNTYYRVAISRNYNGYGYGSEPTKYYVTNIHFFPLNEKYHIGKMSDRVYSVIYYYQNSFFDATMQNHLHPQQLVPAEVLDHKPDFIYRSMGENHIDVVWHIGKKTYVLTLCDLPKERPLFTTRTVNYHEEYFINRNTLDFRRSYIQKFEYSDAHQRFYPYDKELLKSK